MTGVKQGKRVRTRSMPLVAVQELLLDPEVSRVSVQHVVARAGVSQGTFYNFFNELPAALEAVGELLIAEQFRTVLRAIAGAGDAAEVDVAPELAGRLLRDLGVNARRCRRLISAPQEFEPWRPLPLVAHDSVEESV